MSSTDRSQKSLDSFIRPSAAGTTSKLPPTVIADSRPRSPTKRRREDSDSENSENGDTDMDEMDFQHTEHVTATQAIGDTADTPEFGSPQMPLPLSPEHAAMRADFEAITASAMEQLYRRITTDINASVTENTAAFLRTNSELRQQISLLNGRITQLQQQRLANQNSSQPPPTAPAAATTKKVLKLRLEKKNTSEDKARATTAATSAAPMAPSATPQAPPSNTRGWETVQKVAPKTKTSKPVLIPTKYPQAEREVTCHFQDANTNDTTCLQQEKTYVERQALADTALRRVNSAFVDNRDVLVPPFIRARVTIRGSIIFTTSNVQSNVVYEDYTTIIADALSYHGQCVNVEIGKRFSQFLLHGVPTHLSLPEISASIAANYPQLIQGQTPRWLTTPERREHKTNSTIVMTLTGNVKKATIGRQNLIVGNRECQLDDYISYGRSTQCRKCQSYGHPAALCRNDSCCAVCAGPHETREHPCTLPICKKCPACTHPPIRCVNCNAPHKASDPNCPERIKLRTLTKTNTTTTNQGDAPMAGVAE
jgi:hypothetical protein